MNQLLRDKGHHPLPVRADQGQAHSGGQLGVMRPPRAAGCSQSRPEATAEDYSPKREHGFRIAIRSTADVLEARRRARELATLLEFPSIDRTLIASAISELGRNIVDHAERGEISVRSDEALGATGIVITATECGPGVRDVRGAFEDSTGPAQELGLGLPGVRRIMDEFEIVSKPGQGTTVMVKKWKPQ